MRFSIADSIATRCFAHPERIAVEAVGGAEGMTYGEVWRRIAALSDAASRCAPGRHGRLAGLLLPNGADAALAIAACQQAGVVAVPVNGRLTRPEAQYVLSHADCGLLITGGRYADAAVAAAEPLGIAVVSVDGIETPPDAARPVLGEREIGREACVVGYTSGTTGFPKGAIYSHDYYSMNNYRWGWQFGLTPDQVVLITGPMFHLSYAGFALAALTIGARIRIMEDFSAAVALEELRHESTFAFLVPSMLDMVAEEWETLGRPPVDRARHIITAGAPARLPLLRTAMEMFPNARIAEMYGWTEGAFVTYEVKDAGTLVETCVGWPALGADVAVFGEDGDTCPVGEPGEIGVRSAVPFAGYLGDEAATRAAHHRDYLLSGDIGRWLARRAALCRRPQEGRHHHGRGKRLRRRGGADPAAPRGGGGSGRRRRRGQALGPAGGRGARGEGGRRGRCGRGYGLLPRTPGRLQGTQGRAVRRRTAAQFHGEDIEVPGS